ncbi:hypothetical protein ACWD6P_11510 [Streptomyces sp. NPDC002446]
MPTAIAVTSPDLALPAADRRTPAAVVLRAPHLQPLDEALTELGAVLEHHGHLIALYSSACPPEHVRRLHTLRAVLESDRIAIVPTSLPPLGTALLAQQLRQLSLCDFSPGVLASSARLLTHYIHAGALLGSVTGLDRIEVDLRSHLKSLLPGAHFAVLANPEPQLLHLDRHTAEAGLPAPGFATRLALARGQLATDWVTRSLAPAWQVQGTYEERLPAESARWWGTQKLVEFAAAIPDPSVLYQLVASVRREECGWCGLEVLGDRCAFCAAPLARDRCARGGGSSGRHPAAIAGPGPGARTAPAPAAASDQAPPPGPAPAPGPAPECGPPPSPWQERGLSPVAPSGVPGTTEVRGGAPGYGAGPGQLDVRGPNLATGAPARGVPGIPYGSGHPGSGNPYGSGRPVPGNPYASDGPAAPGHWDLPGHPDAARRPDLPGPPDPTARPEVPGAPRTVARAH